MLGIDELNEAIPTITDGIYIFTMDMTSSLHKKLSDDFVYESCLRLLDNHKEQMRINTISDNDVRTKTLVVRLFTRIVLNYFIHKLTNSEFVPFAALPFTYGESGKPLLVVEVDEQKYPLQFNASNSNDLSSIIVEISTRNTPVGIDLSHARQRISSTDFMEQFGPIFANSERQQLLEIADSNIRYVAFNHLWTVKEAFTKLIGSGLNVDLAKICVSLDTLAEGNHTQKVAKIVSEQTVEWKSVGIDASALEHSKDPYFMKLEDRVNFHCFSTVLRPSISGDLPVLASFVTQSADPRVHLWNLNMECILGTI